MKSIKTSLIISIVILAAQKAHADCKLVLLMDRTFSMTQTSAAYNMPKCSLALNALLKTLTDYESDLPFDLSESGDGSGIHLDYTNCPAGSTDSSKRKLVQLWSFTDSSNILPLWTGFVTAREAYRKIIGVGGNPDYPGIGWYDSFGNPGPATSVCPGNDTPLAQAMCRVVTVFPIGTPPRGESWAVRTLTDGDDNSSVNVPTTSYFPGEASCRISTDTDTDWRHKVNYEYTVTRQIQSDNVLWSAGGGTATAPMPVALIDFLTNMAASTSGAFQNITSTTALSPMVTRADSDGDGIPDFRDFCVGACSSDADGDGIPDAIDSCPFLKEDGHGAAFSDGCPDTDFDGIPNGTDACANLPEDGRAPFPSDGCPAAHYSASATPNIATIDNGTMCTSLTVSTRSDSALAMLNISGSHDYRAILRGTLQHNGVVETAFPTGLLPIGSGTFSLTNRQITGLSGDSLGTWTLCITDTDAFGDTGVLNTWSIHY